MFLTDIAALKGRGHIRQPRRQQLGIRDPAPGRTLTDMQPPRQHVSMRRTTKLYRRRFTVTFETKPTPRADNRRCATSRRANIVNASAAVSPSTESAQKVSTAASNTSIEPTSES